MAVVLAVLAGGAAALVWSLRSGPADCRDLGPLSGFPEGSVSLAECVPAFVVRGAGEEVAVYLAESPHMRGEPLRWDPGRRLFVSPFHGEAFGLGGSVVAGPAPGPLRRCPVRLESGRVVIQVARGLGAVPHPGGLPRRGGAGRPVGLP